MSGRANEGREPDVSFEFQHDVEAPRQARRAVRPLVSEDDDPIAQAVEVVTSELVSNVVEHTVDGGTMRAWDPKPDVPFRLEVSDSGSGLPAATEEATERGGRGLRIVSAMSDEWGVTTEVTGKTVWAEFNRYVSEEPADRWVVRTDGTPPAYLTPAGAWGLYDAAERFTSECAATAALGNQLLPDDVTAAAHPLHAQPNE
ncbi:MAG: magnesium or manganese-dependent protein phosphatase [Acidimicrobiales bacterium]|nr:magnesium or manganese-dependent protein phosphatase [Acidimicrobiales bacterium]